MIIRVNIQNMVHAIFDIKPGIFEHTLVLGSSKGTMKETCCKIFRFQKEGLKLNFLLPKISEEEVGILSF